MKKNCCLFFAFTVLFAQQLIGQSANDSHYNNWFTYFAQYKFSPRWGMHLDVQFRADDKVQRIRQSLLRAGAQYFVRPDLNVTLGYAYVNTYSASASNYFTEHRIWQQLIYNQSFGKNGMTHRLRLEQRFVENPVAENDDYSTGHRIRYFNRVIFPFGKNPDAKAGPYAALQDEVFFNFASSGINKNVFDQNRLLVAFGILYQKHTRLEIGYMNQWLNPSAGEDVSNHMLHFSVLQTLNFGGGA